MRIVCVLAQDKIDSFNRKFFNALTAELSAYPHHHVETLDLYTVREQLLFYVQKDAIHSITKTPLASIPLFSPTRDLVLAADVLVLVYPIYWYSMPGIMKTWLDLISNYAWKFISGKSISQHHITQLIVCYSSNMHWWERVVTTRHCIKHSLAAFARFLKIKKTSFFHTHINSLPTFQAQEVHINCMIKKIKKLLLKNV